MSGSNESVEAGNRWPALDPVGRGWRFGGLLLGRGRDGKQCKGRNTDEDSAKNAMHNDLL